MKRFGVERTCYVLAATVQDKDWDGRISSSNKQWAKGIEIPQDKTAWNSASYRRFVVGNAHPGLVDLFVDRDPSDDNPNVVIGFNGKNYVMPRGEVSRVPKYIKDEYERSKRAQYKADKTVAEMKGIKAAN